MRLDRLLANLGYGSRREVQDLLRAGGVRTREGQPLGPNATDPGGELQVAGEPIDPRPPLTLLLHKPLGLVCTRSDDEGPTIYACLPARFARRRPPLATVGRLDKETSGFLLLTDDGALLHRLISPRTHLPRRYTLEVEGRPSDEALERIRAGGLVLRGEERPLRPARVERLGERRLSLVLSEGRYHQVRRMMAALGHPVLRLHRDGMGEANLGELEEGQWRVFDPRELDGAGPVTPLA